MILLASPPSWWTSRGATNANPTEDFAAVNQGQLKHFAQKAIDEMNARIPGGAGTELNSLTQTWREGYQTNGYSASNPNPTDFHAITTGQLK